MSETYDPPSGEGKQEGIFLAMAVVACLALSSCGYSLKHRLKDGFANPQGVFVPVFTNYTDEIGAERIFTDALIRELQSRGEVIVTERKPGALEMRGNVARITYAPSALTNTPFGGLQDYRRLPTEIVVDCLVSMNLIDPKTGDSLWGGSFSSFRRVAAVVSRTHDYDAPSSLGLMQQSIIESQYSGIARDIMRDVYDAMVERF